MKLKKFTTIFILLALLFPLFSYAERIGWITDIHAGSEKKRTKSETNIYYPRLYKQYFFHAVSDLENEGIRLLVVTGDITDHGRQIRYAKRMRLIARRKKMEVLWVRGNHDSENLLNVLMRKKRNYYFVDRFGWRIVVLDNSQKYSLREGGMSNSQKGWLEELLEDTRKPVLIAAHYPLFSSAYQEIYQGYRELESWFSQENKVKIVLTGHLHYKNFTTYDGVKYAVGNPLTLESKMGSYYVVDFDTLEIMSRQTRVDKKDLLKLKR